MEQENKSNIKWVIMPILLTALIGVLSIIIPFLVILIPLVVTIVWVYKGIAQGIIAYAFFAVALYLLSRTTYTILLVLITIPLIISTVLLIKKKIRMYDSVIINSFVAFMGCMLFIGFIYISKGTDLMTYILSEFESILSVDDTVTKYLYITFNDQSALPDFVLNGSMPESLAGVDIEKMQSFSLNQFKEGLTNILPVTIILYSLASGFSSFYFSHLYLRKRGLNLVKVALFKDLSVPRIVTTSLAIMVILSFILSKFEIEIFNSVSSVLMSVFVLIFSLQGYALLIFFYKNKRFSLLLCIILVIVGTLLGVIFWLGFFESLFNLRKRFGSNIDTLNGSV